MAFSARSITARTSGRFATSASASKVGRMRSRASAMACPTFRPTSARVSASSVSLSSLTIASSHWHRPRARARLRQSDTCGHPDPGTPTARSVLDRCRSRCCPAVYENRRSERLATSRAGMGARLSGIMYSRQGVPSCSWMYPIAGGPMPGGDEIRDVQRATWAGLSAGWEKWDSVIMNQLGPVGTAMIERLGIADDQQHLDIASGTGEPGLTVAKLAPRGHVVLTDLAAEMLDIATRRANAQGITNFETKVCSADDLPFGDATFDSISVRFGYMFFPDVAKATAEFARVLKPGGRLCSSVWAGPGENPWVTIVMQAIAAEAVLAPPGPDGPGMFRCAAPGYVSALYEAAGLRDVAEWDVGVGLVTRSPAQYWEMISEHVSLAAAALQQIDQPARERIAKAVIAKAGTYEENGKVRVPGLARCIAGTK